jgi:hypothetical protein
MRSRPEVSLREVRLSGGSRLLAVRPAHGVAVADLRHLLLLLATSPSLPHRFPVRGHRPIPSYQPLRDLTQPASLRFRQVLNIRIDRTVDQPPDGHGGQQAQRAELRLRLGGKPNRELRIGADLLAAGTGGRTARASRTTFHASSLADHSRQQEFMMEARRRSPQRRSPQRHGGTEKICNYFVGPRLTHSIASRRDAALVVSANRSFRPYIVTRFVTSIARHLLIVKVAQNQCESRYCRQLCLSNSLEYALPTRSPAWLPRPRRLPMRTVTSIVAVGLGLACGACGGHQSSVAPSVSSVSKSSPSLTVQHIVIASNTGPTNLRVGQTLQLRAMATLSDGSDQDVTSMASWASENPSVVAVTSLGLVTATGAGTGHVRASYRESVGESGFEVLGGTDTAGTNPPATSPAPGAPGTSPTPPSGSSPNPPPSSPPPSGSSPNPPPSSAPPPPTSPPTVQSLSVSGGTQVPVGQTLQLRATAHMSDGTDRDVTGAARWNNSNSSVASVTQSGVLTGLVPGSNIVSAQYNGATASQPVQVTPL